MNILIALLAAFIYVCLVDSDGEAIRGDTLKLSSVINYVIRGENSEKCLNLMIPGSFTHINRVRYTLGVNINKGTIINLHCVQRKIEEFYIYIKKDFSIFLFIPSREYFLMQCQN